MGNRNKMKSIKISKVKMMILCFLGILIIATIVLGLSMAYIKPVSNPEETNISLKTCAKISFKENSKSINLENTYPMDEEIALEKVKPYEFSINSTCDGYFSFNLYLTSLSTNEIEDQNIHYAITDINKEILTEGILSKEKDGLNDFNTEELKELDNGLKGSRKTIYKIYSNVIPLNAESKYQLYLWLDKDAGNETMGKTFQAGVSLKANKREETLAEYLIKNKDETLIYHDGLPDYEGMENSDLEAGDLAYRFVGSNPNNYVCLDSLDTESCESDEDLYQILGLFKNNLNLYEAKLVKYTPATTAYLGDTGAYYKDDMYHWNSNLYTIDNALNIWRYSNLNKENLNSIYYNYMKNKVSNFDNLVANHIWFLGTNVYYSISHSVNAKGIYEYELGSNKLSLGDDGCRSSDGIARKCLTEDLYYPYSGLPENINTKIGLIYLSDYGYAAYPKAWSEKFHPLGEGYTMEEVKQNNWMFKNGIWEWTLSRRPDGANGANSVRGDGQISSGGVFKDSGYVRPTFYLSSKTIIARGKGIKENPFRLKI